MRFAITVFLWTVITTVNAQSNIPLSKLKFDKVMMYDFEGGKESDLYIIDNSGRLAKTIKKQVQLEKAEANRLTSKMGTKQAFGGTTASCFDPHLGFVYYLNGKVVGHVTVCLDCNRLRSSFEIPAQKQGKVGTGKDSYYTADGLSPAFREYLNELLKANEFSHQIQD
jgi:hypothetical protein